MKPDRMFPVTSVCINDIIQAIDDSSIDKLQKVLLKKKARNLKEGDMNWIAEKLSDSFCDGDFWSCLMDNFERIIEEKN